MPSHFFCTASIFPFLCHAHDRQDKRMPSMPPLADHYQATPYSPYLVPVFHAHCMALLLRAALHTSPQPSCAAPVVLPSPFPQLLFLPRFCSLAILLLPTYLTFTCILPCLAAWQRKPTYHHPHHYLPPHHHLPIPPVRLASLPTHTPLHTCACPSSPAAGWLSKTDDLLGWF